MKRHSSKRSAFTLLEMMLVVTIIALILGAAIYAFKGKVESAQLVRARADIQSVTSGLMAYRMLNGFFPTSEQGLQALVTRPDTDPRPRQWTQQCESLPVDPWQHPYIYVCPGKHNTGTFDLYSAGPDGVPDNDDDITNWN